MTELDPAAVLAALADQPKLRVFVRGGKIETLPARQSRRRLLLDQVAQAFEPGIRYPESAVNDFLTRIYPDCAALRRCLVEESFLDRANGMYWRIGGSVPT